MTLKEAFEVVRVLGDNDQDCLRKGVGCMLATKEEYPTIEGGDAFYTMWFLAQNGPVNKSKCSNEVGNCGCMHAEIRVVMKAIDGFVRFANKSAGFMDGSEQWVMICKYSPCTNCANFIVEFGAFIQTVYFEILTEHDVRGRDRLQDAGIKCRRSFLRLSSKDE